MRAETVRPLPPSNEEAEQALLGAILLNNAVLDREGVDALLPEHFVVPVHGRIFRAAQSKAKRGELADHTTLVAMFRDDPDLVEVGGASYLGRLMSVSASIVNAEHYARAIRAVFVQRRLVAAGHDIVEMGMTAGDAVEDALAEAEAAVAAISDEAAPADRMQALAGPLRGAVQQAEAAYKHGGITGLPTGLLDLDRAITGLHRGNLVVLAARPAMGKTALGLNVSHHAAGRAMEGQRQGIAFFSMEMSAEELAARILADETGISVERVRGGRIGNEDIAQLVAAADRLDRLPLFVDDTPALTVGQVRLRARRLARHRTLALVVVDYIQLMTGSRSDNRVQEISEITRGLKEIAKDLNVPLLALSQLSRKCEEREDKRPILSDLRESGSIEQDADVVIALYRDEVYVEREKPRETEKTKPEQLADQMQRWTDRMERSRGLAEAIILKNRHGATRTVMMHFDGARGRFENLARH